jgi:DNA-binding beta-propeller fold protein YncE
VTAWGAVAALLVAASAASSAPAPTAATPSRARLPLLRPVALFSQHLYQGDLRAPRGIALDRTHDEVWVADTGNHLLGVFTPAGVPVFTAPPSRHLREPSRMVVDARGRLLVLDHDRSRIKVLSYRGEYLSDLELPGLRGTPRFGALATDAEGNLYVGENESGQVLVFSPDLRPRLRFGERGEEDGQFHSIAGIAVAADAIYVVDHQVRPVQVFDRRGNFVRGWGAHDMGVANFSLPEAVAVDSKGHVVVVDALRHEIKFFDAEGEFLGRFGGLGTRPGNVAYPSDVAIDGQDRVYVVEKGNSRVQVFEQVDRATKPR